MDRNPKLEIECATYNDFLSLWDQGTFDRQRFGQAFYNYFQLHKLDDQSYLSGLHEADGKKARAVISRVFEIK
ncbi:MULTISPECIES: hypothetical protein [Pseudomonas]|jgi:hypothetical protein|uniref:hypothetical protein n=1 Tax=Pseudomonas TaxID=286 RepID=UPI0002F6EC4A|nr:MULTISPECIES: hypothetical protein [Pseudomonas]KIR16225.1 hypothetical protein PFLU4_29240 [Pseudomonas fluorescens]AOS37828.1 hypothetical protein A0U95_03380 [Pseudomonas brassicacearum]RDI07403.1 hypothetical protein DFO59_102204 [Pseudomonas fluorescens]ROM86623.1 hypothetical protein BK655_09185 [Pseudomonas brassicacearum]UVM47286.1 hypothetical protein LOY47_13815 [Pseudomonas brassicacearum]